MSAETFLVLQELARDGLAEHRLARRANALILLDRGIRGAVSDNFRIRDPEAFRILRPTEYWSFFQKKDYVLSLRTLPSRAISGLIRRIFITRRSPGHRRAGVIEEDA